MRRADARPASPPSQGSHTAVVISSVECPRQLSGEQGAFPACPARGEPNSFSEAGTLILSLSEFSDDLDSMSGRHKRMKKKNKPRADRFVTPPNEPVRAELQTLNLKEELYPKKREPMNITKMFKKPESVATVAGVGLAFIVAIIYILQWRAMVDTVDITRRVSERDERAWIKVTTIGDPIASPNQPPQWTMRVQNIGKTPARETLAYFLVEVLPNGSEPDFDYSKIRPSMRVFTGNVYPQDASPDIPARRLRYKAGSTTEVEDYVLQPSESADLTGGRSYIVVHGRVQYDDIFRVNHWATFCFVRGFNPSVGIAAANCVFHGNSADYNDEP